MKYPFLIAFALLFLSAIFMMMLGRMVRVETAILMRRIKRRS